MYVTRCCSLCCTLCTEYEFLQNDDGENNKIYDVTAKYFNPMLLTDEKSFNAERIQVLCEDCWFHIIDFHGFQQAVFRNRMLFKNEESVKIASIKVEQEDGLENEAISTKDGEKVCIEETGAVSNSYSAENMYFKAESPKMLEYSHNERPFVIQEEADHHHLNASAVHTDTTAATSYENAAKTPIEQPENEKFALTRVTEVNERELPTKSRRGRRLKCADSKPKYYESNLEDDDENGRKKPKISKGSKGLNMKKARELDAFIAKWKPVLICDMCNETANNFDQLRTHFKEKHNKKCYIKCCEKKFYRRFIFADHIQLHLDPDTYSCNICGKSTTSKRTLELHKKVMHELTKQLKCNICGKLFKQELTLKRHLLIHSTDRKDFICTECGKGFVAKLMLRSHIRYVHNSDYFCNQCGKSIHRLQAFRQHLMEHAGIERAKFICDICGKQFTSSNNLRQHHKSGYHNDGSTAYVCGDCGKVAASENALKRHKKLVHIYERKYKCTYCDKAFKQPISLREHIARHTGQDLYQCPHCPKTFKVSSNMHHHRKKDHPVEWAEAHKNGRQKKININQVKKQVVI